MIRKAKMSDIVEIQKMLLEFAQSGKLLARSLNELYTHIRDTVVYEEPGSSQILGCCSLHIVWEDLAEIRSLAVTGSRQGRGIGRALVEACIAEARDLGIGKLFTLTVEVGFFEHLGFRMTDKNLFPQKVWADCINCPKFPNCDETALVLDLRY